MPEESKCRCSRTGAVTGAGAASLWEKHRPGQVRVRVPTWCWSGAVCTSSIHGGDGAGRKAKMGAERKGQLTSVGAKSHYKWVRTGLQVSTPPDTFFMTSTWKPPSPPQTTPPSLSLPLSPGSYEASPGNLQLLPDLYFLCH